ncbi:hypothetical protein HKD37_06G016476 [Glycine soja]
MLLCCIPCFLVINLSFIRCCTRTISTNLCFFLVYQLNIFPFNFCFVNYSVVYKSKGETKDIELVEEEQARIGDDLSSKTSNKSENYKEEARNATQKHKPKKVETEPLEHTKKRDTGHQSVSLENKTGDSIVLKIGNSAKVVIKQDMKGRRHKYGFNNNKREKAEKKRVVDDETGDKHQLFEIMGSPPTSTLPPPPPPPPSPSPPPSPPSPPPTSDASASPSAVKRTRKASLVHVDPATRKAEGPHKKKLRTYMGIVACDKVDITYENWKEVPTAQKDLIWEDIQNLISQRLLIVGRKESYYRPWGRDGGSLNHTSRGNGPLQPIRMVSRTLSVRNTAQQGKMDPILPDSQRPFLGGCAHEGTGHPEAEYYPHVLSRGGYDYLEQKLLDEKTKKKLEEAAHSGRVDGVIDPPSPVRRHVKWKMARTKKTGEMTTEAAKEIAEKIDVLAAAIGRPEHPGRVRAPRAGVTIKEYFGSAPRTSRNASSLPPDKLQQLTQQIRDQLEESITEKVMRQGLAVPLEPLVGPSGPRVSTKGSCVDPSGNDPETGDSDRCDLCIEADPARLVAMGRVYEGSTVVAVSPPKPPPKPDPEVDDPPYLMTLTIPELFLRPYRVRWDATVFGVVNTDFPLYIKHEDLSEIAHGGISLKHVCEWGILISMDSSSHSPFRGLGNRSLSLKSSQHDVYLGAYLNGPDNYLKGIINSAIKGLDDAPQPKSKASARWIVVKCNRQKGSTECGYYVMH